MKMLILLVALVAFSAGQINNNFACGNSATPYETCGSAEVCGNSGLGCGCTCPSCGSCVFEPSPAFTKACAANVVLVLDESFSILPFTNEVVIGARSFWNEFAQGNQIGGSANLAVVEFSNSADIVCAGQANLNEMRRLDDSWVGALDRYINNTSGQNGCSSYRPRTDNPNDPNGKPSCTNWGAAAQLVKQTPWCVTNPATGVCVPTQPDVVVFFTDGEPTILDGRCDKNCNANRERADRTGLVGPDNGGDLGVACFWADSLKVQGTKVFVVGVGAASNYESKIVKVSGQTNWSPQIPDTWPTSDYVVNPDFKSLGAIFYSIARGLCKCLQDQDPCIDSSDPLLPTCAQQANFDARLRVRTTGVSVASGFPGNSRTVGSIYYSFGSRPPVFAIEEQAPGSELSAPQNNIISTRLYDACNVLRKEICSQRCFAVADKGFIPRFFVSAGDVQEAPTAGFTTDCGVPYRKRDVPQPESVEYIWMAENSTVVCAGRTRDGTMWEFWKDREATIPGVNYRTPVHLSQSDTELFDFGQFDECEPIGKCTASVDLLYVVDWQFSAADYEGIQQYVSGLIASYNNSGMNIRGGIYFPKAFARIPPAGTGLQTDLVQLDSAFRATAREGGPTDFYTMVNAAVESFFPDDVVAGLTPPRYMITLIGGPDAHGPWTNDEVAAWQTLKVQRGIESWAVAVASGANQITLARNIADSSPYDHSEILGSVSLLPVNLVDQALRMCPSETTCSADCQGVCACGECICPDCITEDEDDKCQDSCCDEQSKLCSVSFKQLTAAPLGCVPTSGREPCTLYTCEKSTGNCVVDRTCGDECGCGAVTPCQVNLIDTNNCAAECVTADVTCGCGNLCGSQCNPETGLCGGAKNCDDGNSCTNDTCVTRVIGNPPVATAVCINRDISASICPPGGLCALSVCYGNETEPVCAVEVLTGLLDLCGTCDGDNFGCFFVSSSVNVGGIIGGVFAAGFVIAAIAALVAAFAKRGAGGTPASGASPLQDQALMDNPAFKTPGLAGDMPTA